MFDVKLFFTFRKIWVLKFLFRMKTVKVHNYDLNFRTLLFLNNVTRLKIELKNVPNNLSKQNVN